jgi:Amt family ammonium transporter
LAAGIFGTPEFGGMGGVNFTAQLIGSCLGVLIAVTGSTILYSILKATMGIRMSAEDEFEGADLTIHKISATPDRETSW